MMNIRRSHQRGHAAHGWLDSRHTFSFGGYYDPKFLGFRSLRVINEDRVVAGAGFPTHPHRDMEIISYVLEGALEHRDSMGHGSVIRPGEVQRMSAGTGVTHSEYNPSRAASTHFLQIWIQPDTRGLSPSYEQKAFDLASNAGALLPLATPTGDDGALTVHQDVRLLGGVLGPDQRVTHPLDAQRHVWVQVVRGSVEILGERLEAGDGVAISAQASVEIRGVEQAEFLLFDLA